MTDKKRAFLEAYAKCGNISHAAELSRTARRSHYQWLSQDTDYAAAFGQAKEEAVDRLEEEARRRAVEGVEKPVYQGGRLVGHVREYSDTLLIFLLKGARPERYKERIQVDFEDRVRQIASDLGVNPDEAVEEARRILAKGVSTQ